MKKYVLVFFISAIHLFPQPWNYDYGTGTGTFSTNNTYSLTFLPDPESGGGTDRVRMSEGEGGSFNLENATIGGSGSQLRIVAPTENSFNKFAIYGYTGGKTFGLRFRVRFDGGSSGIWYLFVGKGDVYANNSGFSGAQVFTGLSWAFGVSDAITTYNRGGSSWNTTGLSGTPFTQNTNYVVEIYGNNTTAGVTYYDFGGASRTVASNKFDLIIGGTLIGDDLSKALLPDDTDINSYMFYGGNSVGNVATIYLDDLFYSNDIVNAPLPVELTSFTAKFIGGKVNLNWATATEVNNYGFEVERSLKTEDGSQMSEWEKIGFVPGHGNSNSVKEYSFADDFNHSAIQSFNHPIRYRLKQIDNDGTFAFSKEVEVLNSKPSTCQLSQNFPNPFNPSTVISYQLPVSAQVSLKVYDVLGNEVASLVNLQQEAGSYNVTLDASTLASGTYIYRLIAGDYVAVKKMAVLK
ncbi:MAG: T9SS type A sorting domain-containing protein [Ignavibacteriaceae bacterium]